MSTVASHYYAADHQPWHDGDDGIPWIAVYKDDITGINVDLTDILASGETISSVAWESGGVTVSGEANSTTSYQANFTSVGTASATATLSTGRKIKRTWRLRGIDSPLVSDYGVR